MDNPTEQMKPPEGIANYESEPIPFRCHKAEWLSEILDMPRQQIYNALYDGKIPTECVVRIGRRIRFKEKETLEWILAGGTL